MLNIVIFNLGSTLSHLEGAALFSCPSLLPAAWHQDTKAGRSGALMGRGCHTEASTAACLAARERGSRGACRGQRQEGS